LPAFRALAPKAPRQGCGRKAESRRTIIYLFLTTYYKNRNDPKSEAKQMKRVRYIVQETFLSDCQDARKERLQKLLADYLQSLEERILQADAWE